MKNKLYQSLLSLLLVFSLISLSNVANAYQCAWRNGHKVCWNTHRHHNCRWVNAHWYHGHYYPAHRVCKY